jgi:hypothetical protein
MIHNVRLAIAKFSGIEGDVVVEVEASTPHDAKMQLAAALTKLVVASAESQPEPPCHRGAACAKADSGAIADADRDRIRRICCALPSENTADAVARLRDAVEDHKEAAAQLANERNAALARVAELEADDAANAECVRQLSIRLADLEARNVGHQGARDALEGQVTNLKAQLREAGPALTARMWLSRIDRGWRGRRADVGSVEVTLQAHGGMALTISGHESLFTAELEAALTASNVGRPLVLAPEHQDVTALRERAKATEDELLVVRRVVAQHERAAGEWRAEVGKLTRERDAETKRSDDLVAREPQVIVDGHRLVRYVPPGGVYGIGTGKGEPGGVFVGRSDGSGLDASGRLVYGPVT